MRKYYLILALTSFFTSASAQTEVGRNLKFVKEVVFAGNNSGPKKTNLLDTSTLKELRQEVIKGSYQKKITDTQGIVTTRIFTLKKKERRKILSVLSSSSSASWLASDGLATNEKSIREYSITKPIFLRKGKYCLFYYSYVCGPLCGQGIFAIYKKTNGKWERWIVLTEWNS